MTDGTFYKVYQKFTFTIKVMKNTTSFLCDTAFEILCMENLFATQISRFGETFR